MFFFKEDLIHFTKVSIKKHRDKTSGIGKTIIEIAIVPQSLTLPNMSMYFILVFMKFYSNPDTTKIGNTKFIDPYKKKHWGYNVIEVRGRIITE